MGQAEEARGAVAISDPSFPEGRAAPNESLHFFFETSPLLMGTVALLPDGDLLHLYDNPATTRFFGVEAGATAGRTARSLGAPEEVIALWRARYEEAGRTGEPVRFEYAHGERTLVVTVSPLPSADPFNALRFSYVAEDITEARAAGRALVEREALLQATFEQAAVGLAMVDLDGRWLRVNGRLRQMLGYSEDELRAVTFQDLTHPDDLAADLENVERLLAGDIATYSMEKRYRRRDGATLWGRLTVSLLRDAQGRPERFISVIEDITSRKETEQSLAATRERLATSESRLRLALDGARLAVWEYDAVLRRLQPSTELNRMLGYDPDVALDLDDLRARYHEDDRDVVRDAALRALAAGERFFETQYRFLRPDNALRSFQLRAEILMDAAGAPRGVIGVIMDVTEHAAAEQALREREADLKAAMEAGALAPFEFDHVAGVMAPSPRLNAIYGYPPGHVITLDDLRARYHPSDRDAFLAQAARHQAEPELKPFQWELRLLLPDGQVRWIEGRGEYDRDAAGKVRRSRGVIIDITERKKAEERQQLMMNELNHRVKNTLAIVQSLAHQSFRSQSAPAEARKAFEARLTALASAHNLLTRNSWERATLADVASFSLSATLGGDLERIAWRGPDLTVSPQTAVSLALALHELSTNAIKYGALSQPGGTVTVVWECFERGGEMRFRLVWTERGGPPVQAPERRGFGSRMIEKGLAAELGGQAHLSFEPDGVVYTVEAPLPKPAEAPNDQ